MIRLKIPASEPSTPKPKAEPEPGSSSSSTLPRIKIKQPKKSSSAASPEAQMQTPRISIKPPLVQPVISARHAMPRIRVKPVRQPGQGYDSEDPDREDDPLIEEALIFRFEMDSFSPDEQQVRAPYLHILREAVEGQAAELGQAWIKFKDARHAAVGIRDKLFFAVLVDLPTIIEAQKTLDKKNIYKVADVCQMLLVLDEIPSENVVLGFVSRVLPDSELQKPENKGNRKEELPYPHGITPPMRYARSMRFRRRVVKIPDPEPPKPKEKPLPKVIIRAKLRPEGENESAAEDKKDASHETAEEPPETPGAESIGRESSAALSDVDAPYNMLGGYNQEEGTDAGDEIESLFGNESEEEDDEEEEDEEDEDGKKRGNKMDDEELEAMHHMELLKEEITELENTIQGKERDAENATNPILRNRFLNVVNKLRKELNLKKVELEGNPEE